MGYAYLESLSNHDNPEKALDEADDPEQILRGVRKDLNALAESRDVDSDAAAPSDASGGSESDLSEAKAAAKRALPSSETELTRRNVATSTSAMAAFSKNLPDGVTPSEALDQLE